LVESAHDDFAAAWLRHKGLDWAADLLASEPVKPQDTTTPALEITQ
jgi:type IV secretion system protein VirB4